MINKTAGGLLLVAALAQLIACAPVAWVDSTALQDPDRSPGEWLSYGRGWDEQRFSPLTRINDGNASGLGLA